MKRVMNFILILMICLHAGFATGCTIVMLSKGNLVLAGNNEDWKDPFTSIWFIPATEDAYGRVCFGFGNSDRNPQGGMNDRGLFIDANAVAPTGWERVEGKPLFQGHLIDHILAHCATIEDVKEFIQQYNFSSLERARFPIADRSGASMVVEWGQDRVQCVEKEDDYQISTNFVISNFEPENYPCYRYRTAEKILKNRENYSVELVREILSATHAEGNYPTNYSNIYDLTNGKVYIYNFHNFEDVVVLDLEEELKKGKRIHDLTSLFPYTTHAHNLFLSRSGKAILNKSITSHGIERGVKKYHELKRKKNNERGINLNEGDINSLGYQFMQDGKLTEAIEIFKLNVAEYPESWNVYDSLAEAYLSAGKKELSVENYQKSLELNPENQNAIDVLNELKKK